MRGILALGLLTLAFSVGCGGSSSEVKPDAAQTPQVDQAEIQKQIEEGMKMGGKAYDKYDGAPGAPGAPAPESK